ncbi:MAG: nickel pincer cofactor biosynthesis protein LarB [Promethearchaeota archaeon]
MKKMNDNNEKRIDNLEIIDIRKILAQYKKGVIGENEVINQLKLDYIEKIDKNVQFDLFRKERIGIPEIIYAESKSKKIIINTIEKVLKKRESVLVSRLKSNQVEELKNYISKNSNLQMGYNELGRIAKISRKNAPQNKKKKKGFVGIITAGTSDIQIAEEARMVIEEMGVNTITAYDVGIAGFHRIFQPLKNMLEKKVVAIIAVAGMEGTLPGVISALVDVPVIGVPTSIGYGIGANGIGALTTMLQSCSPGLLVVNIDNGVGAGASAALIALNSLKE